MDKTYSNRPKKTCFQFVTFANFGGHFLRHSSPQTDLDGKFRLSMPKISWRDGSEVYLRRSVFLKNLGSKEAFLQSFWLFCILFYLLMFWNFTDDEFVGDMVDCGCNLYWGHGKDLHMTKISSVQIRATSWNQCQDLFPWVVFGL